ncbi:MAG: hypothetical protein BGO67_03825 [Alphaproteobacteria bacterium 41-28]|nr:MAG: hypothetical protein BGO67_03825 [Alphaproteobacteria bacterium 41-28]
MKSSFPLEPFYFVRHGETNWNKENRIMGQKDIPLNEKGIEQAKHAATLLKTINFTLILSSPLIRAYTTAEIIADKTHKPIVVVEELKECSLGIREGDIKEEWLEEWKCGARIEGAESYTEFTARAQRAFKEALLHPSPVLIVAHNAIYGGIQEALKVQKHDIENGTPFYHLPPSPSAPFWSVSKV